MSNIIIPGRGEMSFEALRIERRLREYDENLSLRKNEHTHEWCVYVNAGVDSRVVLGLGTHLPHVDYEMNQMREKDTWTYARDMLKRMTANNKKIMEDREAGRRERDHETAEIIGTLLSGTKTKKHPVKGVS